MTIQLRGCMVEPLASYLKALAILRIVSEQVDAEARGWWSGDTFFLESKFGEQELVDFFLIRYRPTPIVAPWNGGSGFYAKDRKVGMEAIVGSGDERFSEYRQSIALARRIVSEAGGDRAGSKKDEDERRGKILRECRNRLPDAGVDWLDAAVGISAEGSRAFAPILGTGGNEGRLDYTNNFMERLAELLIEPGKQTPVRALLAGALFGLMTGGLQDAATGQYDPGRAGGFNQGQGVEAGSISNPWDFILTMEGAVAWAAGLYRRQGVGYRSFLCSPFTVRPSAVGYGSAALKDEVLARAEVWTPLWVKPARFAEIRALLREGRASVEGRPAQTGLEFAQAASTLGVDRGITAFMRYSLLKRRGDSYVALPAGQFQAGYRKHGDLIRELMPILEDIDRKFPKPTATIQSLRRNIDEAVYECLLRDEPDLLRDVAAAFGRLYQWILTTGKQPRIRRQLSGEWLRKLEGYPEARIAAALSGIFDHEVGGIVKNLEKLDAGNQQYAWTGKSVCERMTSVLERRILTAESVGARRNPLASSVYVPVADAALFIEARTDDSLIEDLLFAFLLLRREETRINGEYEKHDAEVWPVYALLKLLFLSRTLESAGGPVLVRSDLTILSLLETEDVPAAADLAIRRLQNAGLTPLDVDYDGGLDTERLAASLLIPVTYGRPLTRPVLKAAAAAN